MARARRLFVAVAVALALFAVYAGGASGEQASEPSLPAGGLLDVGAYDSCAVVLQDESLRCWGLGSSGQLGYGTTANVGDVDTPASAGPVDLNGHSVRALAAGDYHTCAILDDGSVRCWGFGGDGRLGYGSTSSVLDPGSVGAVDLGGHGARAITAGGAHTCAILDDGSVRCWGFGGGGHPIGGHGRLGYGNANDVGDTPTDTPGLVGPVDLGTGHTAVAISAGDAHTCAILDDGSVRCWGYAAYGQLGYGSTSDVGDTPTDTPATVGPVNLGGHKATAISAGGDHTCAILDDGSVRCWGNGAYGQLGYGNTANVGDTPTDTPDLVGPVDLGPRKALAVSAGSDHTCALLDDGSVRCWGYSAYGRLGYPTLDSYGNQPNVGDAPSSLPGAAGAVDLGSGRSAVAISAGGEHTCARLDDGRVRCWGHGAYGRLGYCSSDSVGERNTPGSAGPVSLLPGDGGASCLALSPPLNTTSGPGATAPAAGTSTTPRPGADALGLRAQALRARRLRSCLTRAAREPRRARPRARRYCLKRYGRTPGRVTQLRVLARSSTEVVLTFAAPGTDGARPPAARGYLIKQSLRPIGTNRAFLRAGTLCHGHCRFNVTAVGARVSLTITRLNPHTTYYYALAARDNVSGRLGPRSRTSKIVLGA